MTVSVAFPAVLFAQESARSTPIDVGTRSARLSQRVMSPFCPGKTLYDCPSSSATNMRLEMTAWMRHGLSEEAIVRRLEEERPGFDFAPPVATSGLFWAVWVFATLFLLFAARRLVRRKPAGVGVVEAGRDEEAGSDEDEDEAEYDQRLDEALERAAR